MNNRVAGTTVALDAATLAPVRSYSIPGGPDDIAFAPDGKLWITRRLAEKVAVLDPATGEYETIDGRPLAARDLPQPARHRGGEPGATVAMDPFDLAAGWLQEHLLIPLLYQFDMMQWEDIAYGWALFAVYGAVQVAVTFAVCLPLERWRPVEHWPDSKAVCGRCILHRGLPRRRAAAGDLRAVLPGAGLR